jgi:hypothetical protein
MLPCGRLSYVTLFIICLGLSGSLALSSKNVRSSSSVEIVSSFINSETGDNADLVGDGSSDSEIIDSRDSKLFDFF